VIPKCLGGATSWGNVVAACSPCNVLKDSSTAMKPFRAPREPSAHDLMAAKKAFPPNYLHETRVDYLYWDNGLGQ
jgi:5-methylcytosine-specific restriction endonuclease McrA